MGRGRIARIIAVCASLLVACCGVVAAEDAGTVGGTAAEAYATEEAETAMWMRIGEADVQVEWERNESVAALMALVEQAPLEIQMSMFGGFEQVGRIGKHLPRDDEQTTTQPGDIVLYSGNRLVVFYGSNDWAYTRLGRITDRTAEEMAELLSNGDVVITIGR